MAFPIEKYKFVETTDAQGNKQVIAISTYAGRTVKGVATCAPEDEYNLEAGKKLAAAKCEVKVATKRMKFAAWRRDILKNAIDRMTERYFKYCRVVDETTEALAEAEEALKNIKNTL